MLFLNGYLLSVSGQNETVTFKSSDSALQNAFYRAKAMALHYRGDPGDAVGPWYEAALPERYAFCMRDVSHQCIGAEILGMSKENRNMFSLFARNISKSKDWCSYWEINKYGKPAPVDYRNDKEFWYNLDANFDVLNACWRLYLWTGDKAYINNPEFVNFQEKTANEYIERWMLYPDSLLTRNAHLNAPVPFNRSDAFHTCRGLPSYSEGVPGMKMGIDLLAAIYRGLATCSKIMALQGNTGKAALYAQRSEAYRDKIDAEWWDAADSLYRTCYTEDGKFGRGEGEVFLLWFDAIKDSLRAAHTIRHIIHTDWNVESLSYLPVQLYRRGYGEKAYEYILHLTDSNTARREYPEVSYGVMEGIVQGLMGIDPDARGNCVTTLYRGRKGVNAFVQNLPVLQTVISVEHSDGQSVFGNEGNSAIRWRAAFTGRLDHIFVNNNSMPAKYELDQAGNVISYVNIRVKPGTRVTAAIF